MTGFTVSLYVFFGTTGDVCRLRVSVFVSDCLLGYFLVSVGPAVHGEAEDVFFCVFPDVIGFFGDIIIFLVVLLIFFFFLG